MSAKWSVTDFYETPSVSGVADSTTCSNMRAGALPALQEESVYENSISLPAKEAAEASLYARTVRQAEGRLLLICRYPM